MNNYDLDDKLDYPPAVSTVVAVIGGIILPACLAAYAVYALFAHAVYMPGKRHLGMIVRGGLAMWPALAYLSMAAVAHFHLFWGSQAGLWRYRYPLVVVSMLSACVCMGVFWFRFLSL